MSGKIIFMLTLFCLGVQESIYICYKYAINKLEKLLERLLKILNNDFDSPFRTEWINTVLWQYYQTDWNISFGNSSGHYVNWM